MNEAVRLETRTEADIRSAGGILTIDLAALARNYRRLCARATSAPVAAVVKADAYGIGAARVVPVLHEAGCRDFFVAHLVEAARLKPHIATDARLYVLNGLLPGGERLCADLGAIPVLNSVDQIRAWSALAAARGKPLAAALQVDTGMARLGLSFDELEQLAADPAPLAGISLRLFMSHLACADEPELEANPRQLAVLRAASGLFPGVPVSFANSGGVFLGADYHGELARPGVALYGGASNPAEPPMQPVVRLDVRVIQTRTVPAGTAVGYGGTHVTRGETRIATLSAGYADGLPRSLGNRGAAYWNGTRLPIIGRVSMDSLMIDVSGVAADALAAGTLVELIGPHQTLEAIAADAGTISYEILTRLGQRYHRQYKNPETRILASGQGQ